MHEFHGQQGHDAEGHGAGGDEYADQVPGPRPDDGLRRASVVGVDDRRNGVGGVMKAVDELEAQRQKHGQTQKDRARQIDAQTRQHRDPRFSLIVGAGIV